MAAITSGARVAVINVISPPALLPTTTLRFPSMIDSRSST